MKKPLRVFTKVFVTVATLTLMQKAFSQMLVADVASEIIQQESLVTNGLSEAHLLITSAQLIEQTSQLAMELKQLNPEDYQWSNAQNLINDLGNTVNQTDSLAYSADNIGAKFAQMNPGYIPADDYSSQYKKNTATTLNTMNGVLQSLGSSAKDFTNENSRLAFLQSKAQSSQGQLQAIQAASQIASENVSQLQLLRQTITAQANSETAYHANKLQNEASAKAALDSVINAGSTTMKGYGTSGDVINLHG